MSDGEEHFITLMRQTVHAEMATPPDVLFHYTSAEGLLGIVQSQSLHLTNVRFLNDRSELAYGRTLVLEEIQAYARRASRFEALLWEAIINTFRKSTPWFVRETYIACFCEDGDLLSQWRAYQGGYANPPGFSLGFGLAAVLADCVVDSPWDIRIARVEYNPERQRLNVRRWLTNCVSNFTMIVLEPKNSDARHTLFDGYVATARALLDILISEMKDPRFREEREWRLVRMNTLLTTPFFRVSLGELVPYIVFELRANCPVFPLSHVICGPAAEPELREHAVRSLLNSCGYGSGQVVINTSTVPLRSR